MTLRAIMVKLTPPICGFLEKCHKTILNRSDSHSFTVFISTRENTCSSEHKSSAQLIHLGVEILLSQLVVSFEESKSDSYRPLVILPLIHVCSNV